MNPYPYPRDILSPNVSTKQTKTRALIKFLSAMAARRPCAMVAGGIMVFGSIQMLRNFAGKGRQWFRKRRSSTSREHESAAPRVGAGTQTEVECLTSEYEVLLPFNTMAMPEICSNRDTGSSCTEAPGLSSHPIHSRISTSESIQEVHGNTLTKTDASDSCMACGCLCSKEEKEQNRIRELKYCPHPFCQLAIVMALLALHKVSSCEKSISYQSDHGQRTLCEKERKRVEDKYLFKPVTKPVTPETMRLNGLSLLGKSGFQDRGESENDHAASEPNTYSEEPLLTLPLNAKRGPAPSEPKTNAFEIQTSGASEKSSSLKAGAKPFLSRSNPGSNVRQPSPEEKAGTSQASAHADKKEATVLGRKPRGGRKNSNWSRTERTEENGWRHRARPKRRGGRRRNDVPRREYVDLDNPGQVASQHDFRSSVR